MVLSIVKHIFLTIVQWIIAFEEKVIINTIPIISWKTDKNTSYAMDYSIYVDIKKKLKTTEML